MEMHKLENTMSNLLDKLTPRRFKINDAKKLLWDLLDQAKAFGSRIIRDIPKISDKLPIKLEDRQLIYSVVGIVLVGGTIIAIINIRRASGQNDDYLMRGIVATGFDGVQSLKISSKLIKPQKLASNEILIRVRAVSIDHVDIRILQGHGKAITTNLAKKQKCLDANVVAIPGRDCSGVVIKVGDDIQTISPGDEVWAYSPPWKNGLMTEYISVKEEQVATKPNNTSFTNAASVPYAALITWDALVNQAGLDPQSAKDKRVLIHLGSYAIGALAIQMVKLWGGHVTTTVPTVGLPLVRFLGADDVIVYSVTNFQEELLKREKFDVVFNTVGSILHDLSMAICNDDGSVVSAVAPFPSNIEIRGLFYRFLKSIWLMVQTEFSKVFGNPLTVQKWELFSFDKAILAQIKTLVENGKIQPIVEDVFNFDDAILAFERVATGDTVGRIVISFD